MIGEGRTRTEEAKKMSNEEDSKKKAPQTSPAGVAGSIAEESSESENETEPARIFQRRVSTSKTLNGSVSNFFSFFSSSAAGYDVRLISIAQMLRPNISKVCELDSTGPLR